VSQPTIVKVKTGSPFETKAGYSRVVAVGDLIFVSNTAGINYQTRVMPPDAAGQARQCLANISGALAAVDATLADVVATRVFVPNSEDWDAVVDVLGEHFRGIDPTSTFTASPLAGAYLVEIEVTAYRGAGSAPTELVTVQL
jgi:enamine deaminase RidA (YjgF/YER057c/UK114 family)